MALRGYIAGHSFSQAIPENETKLAFQLKCLQNVPRGAAPEDWLISLTLSQAPEGYLVGEPVYEFEQIIMTQSKGSGINFSIEGIVPQEDGVHIFFRITTDADPSTYLAISPGVMYAIDAEGTRIDLINVLPWSPFDKVEVWEYRTALMPADGPMTIVIENTQIHYLAQDLAFEFNPGAGAQLGQTWQIDKEFGISGYQLTVESARMIELDGHPGFEFTITSNSENLNITAELIDNDLRRRCGPQLATHNRHNRSQTGICVRVNIPETIRVTFNTIAIQIDSAWQSSWTPACNHSSRRTVRDILRRAIPGIALRT